MSETFGFEVPPELIEALVSEVTARVLAALPEPPPPSPYFSVAEAAEFLRCPRQRIDDLLSQRRLTRVKDGSRTLIARTEIERYLREERR